MTQPHLSILDMVQHDIHKRCQPNKTLWRFVKEQISLSGAPFSCFVDVQKAHFVTEVGKALFVCFFIQEK